MKVEILTHEREEAWTAFVASHPDATMYHTLAWKRVTEKTFGFKALYLVAESAGRITAVLPGFILRGGRFVSMPLRDRGGILSMTQEATSALCGHLKDLKRQGHLKSVELKADRLIGNLPDANGFAAGPVWVRLWRDLPASVAELDASLKGSPCWRARQKSLKTGVETAFTDDAGDWREFYEIFLETRRRLGVPPYAASLFEHIREELGLTGGARLLIARQSGCILAGMVFFHYHDTLIYAYGASRKESLDFRVNDRLIYDAMVWSIGKGVKTFDFGADHPQQHSLIRFKSKWATNGDEPFSLFLDGTGGHTLASRQDGVLFRLASAAFRKLPRGLYRKTSWLTRFLAF